MNRGQARAPAQARRGAGQGDADQAALDLAESAARVAVGGQAGQQVEDPDRQADQQPNKYVARHA
jgi:hypothetical protein